MPGAPAKGLLRGDVRSLGWGFGGGGGGGMRGESGPAVGRGGGGGGGVRSTLLAHAVVHGRSIDGADAFGGSDVDGGQGGSIRVLHGTRGGGGATPKPMFRRFVPPSEQVPGALCWTAL